MMHLSTLKKKMKLFEHKIKQLVICIMDIYFFVFKYKNLNTKVYLLNQSVKLSQKYSQNI